MPAESWKSISLVSAVQVLSEGVFFAQGILASDENENENKNNVKPSGQDEFHWIRICVPLFYAAIRQISEPCWRWILGGYGNRMTTGLGIATITVSVIAASSQKEILGNTAYIVLGGIGMGLVRLQLKLMKSHSDKWSLWGAGISGIGLSIWPLLACLFIRSFGTRYAVLILAGITLHAVPLAIFIQPVKEERGQNPEEGATIRSTMELKEIPLNTQLQKYRLISQLFEYNSYRVRPSYYVEVLPGIPEEVEYDSDHERDHEMECSIPEIRRETSNNIKGGSAKGRKSLLQKKDRGKRSERMKIRKTKTVIFKAQRIEQESFTYTIFIATILLRLGDQFGVIIIVSFLPIFANYLMPNLRLQEKAFLISLCGFSKVLAELPLLGIYWKSEKRKFLLLGGPIFAAIGLYLTWNSTNLDAMTLANFGLGIGSGAASAALQILARRESPGISDIADIVVGIALLAIIPLARILILGHAIQGCLLLAAGIYTAAAICSVFNLRKEA